MPYQWSPPAGSAPATQLSLWPHRSLPRRGFVIFIVITCAMLCLPLMLLLGTSALWGVLPFPALAVAGVWLALQRTYLSGRLREELHIDADTVQLTRVNPRGDIQAWECNSHWARACLHPVRGPVPNYITLRGEGREVELGAFLSEDERKTLYGEVQSALSAVRRP